MPELPEVETVRTGLEQLVVHKTIQQVEVLWPSIIETTDIEQFKLDLQGEEIQQVTRRGKFLIFHLTHYDLISHLRMEGKYEYYLDDHQAISKHTHVIFKMIDGSELRYLDVRKFGRMALVPKGEANQYKGIKKLGPEPVLPDFNLAKFTKDLNKRQTAIKPLLLTQQLVTGLGNIYVDEALFRAKIHPEQVASDLSKNEIKVLHQSIIAVLAEAVKAGGTTIRTYKNALGEAGNFQVALKVYGQTGEPCPNCGTPIRKIKVAQRGTHFCPHCQKR